jgi:hypothetical protein
VAGAAEPAELVAALRALRPLNAIGLAGDPYAPGASADRGPSEGAATAPSGAGGPGGAPARTGGAVGTATAGTDGAVETRARRDPPTGGRGPVCAVRFEPDRIHYRLASFPEEGSARAAGWTLTHHGACGTCSTLQDLAVYLERPDLTGPARRCAALPLKPWSLSCFRDLGFSEACARTWYWNGRNTARECLGTCLWAWVAGEPSNSPDGSLNGCLRCDEERSGPVFKRVAGRTRRNSGIVSSIGRAEGEVEHVVHEYPP